MGILLVYDVTDRKSFENIRTWFGNVEQHASEDVNKILIGNKCDWEEKRQVSREEGEQLAASLGVPFVEASAKANIKVEEAFMQLARQILKRLLESNGGDGAAGSSGSAGVRLDGNTGNSLKSKCC
jgi:Ras-related protein Rab-8A